MAKGGEFERQICKLISNWWSEDKRDDLFWRSSNSGGRATVRKSRGKETAGHVGDIVATSREGEALLKLVCIEVKRGYSADTVADLLDCTDSMARQTFEKWVQQARTAQRNSGAKYWMIIQRRDKRQALVFFPKDLVMLLRDFQVFKFEESPYPCLNMWCELRKLYKIDGKVTYRKYREKFVGMRLSDFFDRVKPQLIRELACKGD